MIFGVLAAAPHYELNLKLKKEKSNESVYGSRSRIGNFWSQCMYSGREKNGELCGEAPILDFVWKTPKGLKVPESVMYDEKNQVLYVSNINGKPTLKNNKGFITKIGLAGSILNLDWVTGLNAPKGMGIFGDVLYVTDIDRVLGIQITTGTIIETWNVQGAQFLNDIAIDAHGTVFISDMKTQTIHSITAGQLDTFLVLDYTRPNGLLMRGKTLLVGTAQGIVGIDTLDKSIALEIEHQGGIDGIKPVGDGRFIVSDWKGKIQIIEKNKPAVMLLDTSEQKINAADLNISRIKTCSWYPLFFPMPWSPISLNE